MSSSTSAGTALLTEHLRYTPLTLLDDIINTINELTNRAVDAAETGLLAADPSQLGFAARAQAEKRSVAKDDRGKGVYPEARQEIEEGVHKLETLLEANLDRNFDKFEIVVLRSILAVPKDLVPWIRLAHYESVPENIDVDASITPESLQQLRSKVRETRKLQRALQSAVAQNNATIAQLKALTSVAGGSRDQPGSLAFLTQDPGAQQLGVGSSTVEGGGAQAHNPGPLETNVSFALSQLPALRALLDELRPKMAELSESTSLPADEKEAARERRAYVEAQTRRAVQRQGVGADSGAVDAFGRAVSVDELAELETLASGLRGQQDDEQMDEDDG